MAIKAMFAGIVMVAGIVLAAGIDLQQGSLESSTALTGSRAEVMEMRKELTQLKATMAGMTLAEADTRKAQADTVETDFCTKLNACEDHKAAMKWVHMLRKKFHYDFKQLEPEKWEKAQAAEKAADHAMYGAPPEGDDDDYYDDYAF